MLPAPSASSAPAAAASTSTWVASGPNSTVVVPPRTTEPVGDAQRFGQVRGHDQDRGAVVGEFGDDPMDLLLGADVDALGRLGEHQDLRPLDQLPGQHHLLGVAARHRADRLALARRLHGQPRDHVLGDGAFARPVHPDPCDSSQVPAEMLKAMDWKREHALELAVRGQQRDAELWASPRRLAA